MPHAHCLLWVEGAPHFDADSDDDVCTFIDHYITGKIPLDTDKSQDIRDLAIILQMHALFAYCR